MPRLTRLGYQARYGVEIIQAEVAANVNQTLELTSRANDQQASTRFEQRANLLKSSKLWRLVHQHTNVGLRIYRRRSGKKVYFGVLSLGSNRRKSPSVELARLPKTPVAAPAVKIKTKSLSRILTSVSFSLGTVP